MKRGGFFVPVVTFFMLFSMLAIGFILERSTAKFRIIHEAIHNRLSSDTSYLGMKFAEDWLISAVLSEDFPTARENSETADPMDRIEAVCRNGNSIGWDHGEPSVDVKLYVADIDYKPGIFAGELANKRKTPFIPRIPRIETELSVCRFYYIRCAASAKQGASKKMMNEELLAVSMDKSTRQVVVTRLFYRYDSE
jgi:hypothetical protein